jgi:cystathionine beta-lyase/cystathionine gamma-synthase
MPEQSSVSHRREGEMRLERIAIHAGNRPDAATGAICVPIYQTSTLVFEDVGRTRGWDYSRTANPIRRIEVSSLAESPGGITSLAGHPATMSHASMRRDCRERAGITGELLRLSVGLENIEDSTWDLEQALNRL